MTHTSKKILVGCPTSNYHEYCLKEYAKAVKSLTYPHYDVLLVDNSKDNIHLKKIRSYNLPAIKGPYFESARDRIITSRNILRQHVLDHNYDYLFSLEQDVIPPINIIERLLKHNKKVISGVYYQSDEESILKPLVYGWVSPDLENKEIFQLPYQDFKKLNKKLIVASTGLGCILIHRSILKQFEFRYEKERASFDDWIFCSDLKKKGIKVYVDTSLVCKHLFKDRPWKWTDLKK